MEHAINEDAGLSGFPWIWLICGLIVLGGLLYRFGFERTTEQNGKIVSRFLFKDYLPASLNFSNERSAAPNRKQHSQKKKRQLRHLYELKQVVFGLLLYGLGVFLFGLGFVYAITENSVAQATWQFLCLIGIAGIASGIYIIVTRHRNNPFRKKMVALERDSFLNTAQQRKRIVTRHANASSADTYR